MIPPFRLRTTSKFEGPFFFCNLGGWWHPGDTRRLIERTTSTPADAKEFATAEEAREILTVTDNLKTGRWEIVDSDGQVVK